MSKLRNYAMGAISAAGGLLAVMTAMPAMATPTNTYADVFTAVDLSTFTATITAIAVLLVGVWLVFGALRLGKRIISRV